jgi:hypothetical protein
MLGMLLSDRAPRADPPEVRRVRVMLRRAGVLLALAASSLMLLVVTYRGH